MRAQDVAAGDGTTSVTVICGALLRASAWSCWSGACTRPSSPTRLGLFRVLEI